jgi:hypothetical protein
VVSDLSDRDKNKLEKFNENQKLRVISNKGIKSCKKGRTAKSVQSSFKN